MKKRFFSLLLAAMLTINPIAVSATEMSNGDEDIEVISTEIEIEEVVGTELGQETQIEETTEVAVEEKQEEPVASTEDAKTEVEAEAETEKETEVFVDDDNDEVEITEKDSPYLALGADHTDDQRQKVLALMAINPEMLED